ncbi:hypothetical protein [Amycolatopsis palatopharyngis]|uniref:hypothetical protein n=1 Tax=Amycolatopsis palatopharyngis TaxID=187982 RepID=UPI000E2303B2|nr:hypothetical protein [Amycolatopsis palatopharyngis]
MIKPRLRLADTAAIASLFRVAPGTVRYWASVDRWTPYGTRRHRQWNLLEAQASYDQRHTQEAKQMDTDTAMVARREKLCEFIRAHGLDPNDIPEDFDVELDGGNWHIERLVRNEGGDLVLNPENPDQFKREIVTVPYAAPWPL